jgi:hypothetical protein
MAFTASRSALSPQNAAELADDLAARLVETSRFRVLPREWLPTPAHHDASFPPAALREAAVQAGVEYLVFASVTGLAPGHSSPPPAILTAGRAILALSGSRRAPVRCRPARSVHPSFASVQGRVIDVASGAVVRTSVARARLGTALAATGLNAGCGSVGAAASLALVAAQSQSDVDSLKRANADIASTLNLPARASRSATN